MSDRNASVRSRLATTWENLRTLWFRALHERTEPYRIGIALGVGVLIGSCPLPGLHTVLALAIATLVRLNRVATWAGSNISFGPFFSLLAVLEVAVGSRMLGLPFSHNAWAGAMAAQSAKTMALSWWAGYVLIGPTLAVLSGTAGYVAARRRAGANVGIASPQQGRYPRHLRISHGKIALLFSRESAGDEA